MNIGLPMEHKVHLRISLVNKELYDLLKKCSDKTITSYEKELFSKTIDDYGKDFRKTLAEYITNETTISTCKI